MINLRPGDRVAVKLDTRWKIGTIQEDGVVAIVNYRYVLFENEDKPWLIRCDELKPPF